MKQETCKKFIKKYFSSVGEFAAYFGVPVSTARKWHQGVSECPDYFLRLMQLYMKDRENELQLFLKENDCILEKIKKKYKLLFYKDNYIIFDDNVENVSNILEFDSRKELEEYVKNYHK